jgi:hypothetical protein
LIIEKLSALKRAAERREAWGYRRTQLISKKGKTGFESDTGYRERRICWKQEYMSVFGIRTAMNRDLI